MSFRIYFPRSSIWVQLQYSNSNGLEAVIKWSQDVLFENVCRTEKMGNKFGPNITSISYQIDAPKDSCSNWGSGRLHKISRLMVKHILYFYTPWMEFFISCCYTYFLDSIRMRIVVYDNYCRMRIVVYDNYCRMRIVVYDNYCQMRIVIKDEDIHTRMRIVVYDKYC